MAKKKKIKQNNKLKNCSGCFYLTLNNGISFLLFLKLTHLPKEYLKAVSNYS